jgi:Family of unknown function (DUF5681)
MDSEEIKRMVITGTGRGKPPEHSRFAKGQSGNPKGRPRKAPQPALTLADQPTLSALLNIANRTVDVRQDGKSVSMSRGDAVIESVVVSAIKGNARSQALFLDMKRRADAAVAAERRSSNELWSNYKRDAYARIAAAKKQDLPPPALVPHPDDIIIDPSNDVRFIGPIDDEEQARLEQTLKLRDVLIMQSALDNRSTHRLDGEPLSQPGSAEIIAMLLDRTVPPRLRLPSINWAMRSMQYEGMSKRELLKSLFTAWRKLKSDVPRGFVFPNMDGVVRHVTMINTLLADIQNGAIDPDAMTVEEFAEGIEERELCRV